MCDASSTVRAVSWLDSDVNGWSGLMSTKERHSGCGFKQQTNTCFTTRQGTRRAFCKQQLLLNDASRKSMPPK